MKLPQRAFTPVVHAETQEQALRNVAVALDNGGHGVWLISHGHLRAAELLGVIQKVREKFSDVWLGVNFLSPRPELEFGLLGEYQRRGIQVDGLWVDNPMIAGANPGYDQQDIIAAARKASGWQGEYYGGVAFKYLDPPADLATAVRAASKYVDVIVTTGPQTGIPASLEKVKTIVDAAQGQPVVLASGVNEKNIEAYVQVGVTQFLVATSLSVTDALGYRDDANLDGAKVKRMRKKLDAVK